MDDMIENKIKLLLTQLEQFRRLADLHEGMITKLEDTKGIHEKIIENLEKVVSNQEAIITAERLAFQRLAEQYDKIA